MVQKNKTQKFEYMKRIENDTNPVDVNKAWNTLYARLEKEQLLPVEAGSSPYRKRKIPLEWITVAAAVCTGFIFSIFYFSQGQGDSLLFLQNKENSGALVATLDDGSTVYLSPNASVSYPAVFASKQRKVKLDGNALFCVTKDEKRPFLVETNEKITIEVVGTIFAVQSAPGKPFELSVKEGKVNVHTKDNPTIVPVEAGEALRLDASRLSKSKITNPLIFNHYKDKLCFKDEKLNRIVQAINTSYGSPVIIVEKSLKNRTLTLTFEDNSVETMTEIICLALNLEQIYKQDTIFIRQP